MAMKMYRVFVGEREYYVGKVEMEYLSIVFGDKARIETVELPPLSGSDSIVGDENSFNSTHREGR